MQRLRLYVYITAILLIAGVGYNARAQHCATYTNFIQQYTTDASFAHRYDSLQAAINTYIAKHKATMRSSGLDTISVVVHIVYNTPTENISAAQVQSQIDVLNTDYARLNADTANTPAMFKPIASGTRYRFALARRDPNGKPTTGIVRAYTSNTSFTNNNAVKYTAQGGDDVWDRTTYLNIWVCNLTGGILGYTQYPGGTAATDGSVVNYQSFGTIGSALAPFNLGRTCTHEVGHWFNLIHIWGDVSGTCSGSDSIADTPPQYEADYGCPTFPSTSCSNNSDVFMDYMEYTNDDCMNLFTQGQATRMDAAANVARASVLSSKAYAPLYNRDAGIVDAIEPSGVYCDSTITPTLTVFNFGKDSMQRIAIQYTFDNNTPKIYWWYGVIMPGAYISVTLPHMHVPIGTHTFKCYLSAVLNNDNYALNDSATSSFSINRASTTEQLPLNETFESGVFPAANWQIDNIDNTPVTWALSSSGISAYGIGNYSAVMQNYYQQIDIAGTKDAFITPAYDLSNVTNPQLAFDVAYSGYYDAHYGTYNYDSLKVLYSTDCGKTWNVVYSKSGTALQTTAAIGAEFVPTANQWRTEQVPVSGVAGQNAIELEFLNISGWGNDLYVDNIHFTNANAGVTNVPTSTNGFSVYPNPANEQVTIENTNTLNENVHVVIYDMLGRPVYTSVLTGRLNTISLNNIAAGLYVMALSDAANIYTQKIVVKH